MFIYCDTIEEMVTIVARLVREGLTFKTTATPKGGWQIHLTGGY